jgi:hypothetical protein
MANSNITLTSLDFADYKNSLKSFLQSQSQFQDYNFEGSNLSVILDLLSYNTYLNAFYMNMIGSEMFLDTAQQRDSVILRAKELNYLPRSFKSAYALVNLVITPNAQSTGILLTIPSGTSFTGKAGSNSYTFSTNQNLVLSVNSDGKFYASNIALYEGTFVTDTFIVQPIVNTNTQAFTLTNPTIDTSSLTVVSVEGNGANVVPYLQATSLLDIASTTPVYFLQGGDNSRYQIIFGDNVVGRRPPDNSAVVANYRVTNGQLPNGIATFIPNGSIGGTTNIAVTTLAAAQGGDIGESIESIKFNAPRHYATQERAVTTADYETILQLTYPEIEAISVYGGETTIPPQYGKVFVSLKLYNYNAVPQSKILEYTSFLSTRAPLTIQPVFVEPEVLYASINTTVKYNVNQTALQPADIAAFVTSAIQSYNLTNLDNFKSTLLYSRLVEGIDNAHPSIVSNQTRYQLMKKLVPSILGSKNYTINFGQALNSTLPAQSLIHPTTLAHTVRTTNFYYNGLLVHIEDDALGNLRIVQEQGDGNDHTLVSSGVGTVDYTNGIINLTNFYTPDYIGTEIRIYVDLPDDVKDSYSSGNVIYEIPNDEIKVNVQIVRQ